MQGAHTQGGREAGLWRTSRTLTSRYGGHTCLTERAAKARERETGKSWECAMSHKTPNSQGRSHYSQSSGEKLRLLEVI